MARGDPTIRFLRLNTGERLAFATQGKGPPLVCPAWWVSHLEEDWKDDGFRAFFGRLARHYTLIRYDRIGAGLSDRARERVDLDGETSTLSQLADHLSLSRFSVFAVSCAGPPSLVYASTRPERVAKLVFFASFLRGRDVGSPAVQEAVRGLVRAHWGLGARTITNLFAPDLTETEVERLSRQQRHSASAEMAADLLGLTFDVDARSAAARVETPALVLHREGDRTVPHEAGRELAAALPNSAFRTFEGRAHVPWLGDAGPVLDAIVEFLGTDERSAPPRDALPVAEYELHRSGDVWRLTYGGRSVHLKDARGLGDLAVLLANPGQEIHVTTLWYGARSVVSHNSAAAPVLDEAALASYRARLRDLAPALAAAKAHGDEDAALSLEAEQEAILEQLRSAVGLGGRKRRLNDASERARKAVSARIHASIKKIHELNPELAAHLEAHVSTGMFCSYDASEGIEWVVSEEAKAPPDPI